MVSKKVFCGATWPLRTGIFSGLQETSGVFRSPPVTDDAATALQRRRLRSLKAAGARASGQVMSGGTHARHSAGELLSEEAAHPPEASVVGSMADLVPLIRSFLSAVDVTEAACWRVLPRAAAGNAAAICSFAPDGGFWRCSRISSSSSASSSLCRMTSAPPASSCAFLTLSSSGPAPLLSTRGT